jgi:hypothetical protein
MKPLLVLAIAASAAMCQQAQIAGVVRDPGGLNVAGAEVSVRNEETGGRRQTRTNESAFYSVASLNPGTYRILIRHTGFETIVQEGVRLEVGDKARLDFSLRIGDSHTIVTVGGGPPLMNTEDASVGTVIGRDIIDEMPLNGRGIQSLIELTPGVEAVPVTQNVSGQFSVNGQRADSNYFTVDGVSANFESALVGTVANVPFLAQLSQTGGGQLPANNLLGTFSNLVSPDALQEFKIQTSTFAPEFGRAPGAQVGFITRSGTTRYSGSLFEYFRNDIFDANDWFADQQGLPKTPLRFNNFGGTLGGPVQIPHRDRRNARTFFFFSFEDLVMRQPQPTLSFLVPDMHARLSVSPLAAPLYDALPAPNAALPVGYTEAPGWGGFALNFSLPNSQQTWATRLDHYFSDNLIGFARYSYSPSRVMQDYPVIPLTPYHYSAGTNMLTAGITEAASAALVNDFRASLSQQNVNVTSTFSSLSGAKPFPADLFPSGFSQENSDVDIADLEFPGLPGIAVGPFSAAQSRQLQFVDQLSYTRGRHQFKFGVDYRLFRILSKSPKTLTEYDFEEGDLASGVASLVEEEVQPSDTAYRSTVFSAYAQDTWHALPGLSITYGLRWELEPAPRPTAGQVSVYQPLAGSLNLATLSAAPPNTPFYPTRFTNFAPRLGFAWQIPGCANKTVLRAGAGTFYDSSQIGFQQAAATALTEYGYLNVPLGGLSNATELGHPLSSMTFAPVAVSGFTLPRTYEWNITMEESFGQQTFSAAYVGALGRKLLGTVPGPILLLTPPTLLPEGLQITGNYFSSSYNSLQLQFNRRLSKRLQTMLSYTWSHSIDNRSDQSGDAIGTQNMTTLLDPDQNRGDSDFDVRHSLHGAIFAHLPSPRTGFAAIPLRNWTVSTIFFVRSALPTNVLTFTDQGLILRPDIVAGQPLYLYSSVYPGGKRYNPGAFVNPPDGVAEGDLGRNVLRGFGAWQADFALHREFRLAEHTSVQVRGEAFNFFNHPNFANPSGTNPKETELGPSFGESTNSLVASLSSSGVLGQLNQLFQVGGPRSLQLALRLTF